MEPQMSSTQKESQAASSTLAGPVRTVEQSLRLRRIFDDTHALAWRMLSRFGVPEERVEDLYQQVFQITAERLDDILPGAERSFVYSVTFRVARTFLRNKGREVLGDEPDRRAGSQLSAEVLLDRRRFVEVCNRILRRLGPELREVLILHELEGFTGSEIARLLGIPQGTVHSRLRRARLQVRGEVAALGAVSPSMQALGG
jgi:RNA polymerase sigma-70 factor (ECF subfamily)